MTEEQRALITPTLNTIKNDDIRQFAEVLLDNIPSYIWDVPASSTSKYHPSYSLGKGGLMRHQIAVVTFLNMFFDLEQYNSKLTDREMDLMRVSGLIHDGMKSGTQEDYEKSKWTKFDHPIRMAEFIRAFDGKYLSSEELNFVAEIISTHMGQFNTDKRSSVVLPKPSNKYQRMIHLADYLASRKNITLEMNLATIDKAEEYDINTYKVSFPKHKGKTLLEIKEQDPGYIAWMKTKPDWNEPIKTFLTKI